MRVPWMRAAIASLLMAAAGAACGSADDSQLTEASTTGGKGGSSSGSGGTDNGGAAGLGGSPTVGGSSGTGGAGGGTTEPSVRFVAIGDCGKGNAGQLEVATAVQAKCAQSGCDFVQLLGDNIYDSGVTSVDDPQWWTKFEQPYQNITLPFYSVLGNHDYGGNGTGNEPWRADVQVAYTLKSTKWRMPARYYGHTEPGTDFFGLDTNSAMFGQHAQQKQEVAAWIAQSTATWKLVFGHHPYRSNGPHGNAGSYENLPLVPIVNGAGVKDLLDSVVCGKVDLYISGHDHSLQWLEESCQGTELLVSGGGSTNTDLPGQNPSFYQSAKTGFLYVQITGKSLIGEFYDAQGKLEYSRTLTKP
jgi:hypothetical protein